MIREPLERLYKGELSFDAFVLQTRLYWFQLSNRIIRKWKVPPSVSVDDIVQEMLLKCWKLLDTYEEGRSTIDRYIVYNCMEHAKRWIHKQREAKHHKGSEKSRYPLSIDDCHVSDISIFPTQDETVSELEKIDLARTRKESILLKALFTYRSIDLVTDVLYTDCRLRLIMQYNSYADARRNVYRSAKRIADRLNFE